MGWIIVALIFGFVSGLLVGLNHRSKEDLDGMLNSFAEAEHLRSENKYLKEKLERLGKEE